MQQVRVSRCSNYACLLTSAHDCSHVYIRILLVTVCEWLVGHQWCKGWHYCPRQLIKFDLCCALSLRLLFTICHKLSNIPHSHEQHDVNELLTSCHLFMHSLMLYMCMNNWCAYTCAMRYGVLLCPTGLHWLRWNWLWCTRNW